MSTNTTPSVDQSAANIQTARSYFFNMFERHNPDKFGRHSYNMLDRANIALDSRFSVEASFFEVWRGLIDTPRSDWRFERTIFCLENKGDMSCGFNRKNEYFVLPAEAMVNMLDNDKATHEAVVSFHFNHKIFKLPDNEVHDDLKLCSFEKPSTQYIKNKVGEASYIVSLRISNSSSIPSGIKKALLRMDATFQSTYNRIMEVRSLHQSKIKDQENATPPQELKADASDTTAEGLNQADSNKPKPSSSTKSKSSSPKKSSPKSTDTANSDKECSYCARKTTPMWRRGPAGPGTLCNACGVKWRHGKILCNGNSTETAASPSTATTENVDPLDTAKPNETRTKRKYTKSTEISQPPKKQQKKISKKSTTTDLVQDEGSEISSSPSSSESPHSLDLNTLIIDEAHQALGIDAVEAATVLTLLKRS